jgi:Mg-chelatase subunit ChlI
MADLIGDIDPLKAAHRKLDLSNEEVIHFGILPRLNRGIFAINELPDLAPRIQVGLLNVLEERDIQIRGFPVRIPLDMLLVFTANPEDYTNRGSIITPLKDRIASQILTHYPRSIADARASRRSSRRSPFAAASRSTSTRSRGSPRASPSRRGSFWRARSRGASCATPRRLRSPASSIWGMSWRR